MGRFVVTSPEFEYQKTLELYLGEHPRIVELAGQNQIRGVDQAIRGASSTYFNQTITILKANRDAQIKSAQQDGKQILARNKIACVWIIIGIVMYALMGIFFSATVARNIGTPLKRLVEQSAEVVGGNLAVSIDRSNNDEVGLLSDAFNTMVSSLKQVIGRVVDLAGQVAVAAEQLRKEATRMVIDSEKAVDQTMTMAIASEEMAVTANDIARNCTLAALNAQQANDAAITSAVVIKAAVDGMNRIAERVRHTSQTVEGLGVRSDQIGAIVETIEDITDQTSLLALNAAIEAARAATRDGGSRWLPTKSGRLPSEPPNRRAKSAA